MTVGVDLRGRRVLVTGASSGIGAAVCRSIVGCGGSVAMVARRKDRLAGLHDDLGERAVPVPGDVTDFDALDEVVADAAQQLGGLDGLVAVAGKTMAGGIVSGTPQTWREVLDLNLVAPLATVRAAIGHFPGTGRRDVVFVGSTGGITPMPGVGVYGASKRGLRAAFDSLRLELAPSGVNAGLVMPGMFETEGLTLDGLVIDGEVPPNEYPLFTPGTAPADPAVLGDMVAFMIGQPEGVCINELVARPTGQLNP
jgi:3-oxoacyl-[acyl-carrier protein] reductase